MMELWTYSEYILMYLHVNTSAAFKAISSRADDILRREDNVHKKSGTSVIDF